MAGFSVIGYFSVKTEWKNYISRDEAMQLVNEVKSADELPYAFYELFEIKYPNSLHNNFSKQFFKGVLGESNIEVPSYLVASNSKLQYKIQNKKGLVSFIWFIEENTSQKECLNYYVSKFDYMYNSKGIAQASKYYFNKDAHDLNKNEIATFIIMLENPYYYNPKKHKERLAKKVKKMLSSNKN